MYLQHSLGGYTVVSFFFRILKMELLAFTWYMEVVVRNYPSST